MQPSRLALFKILKHYIMGAAVIAMHFRLEWSFHKQYTKVYMDFYTHSYSSIQNLEWHIAMTHGTCSIKGTCKATL